MNDRHLRRVRNHGDLRHRGTRLRIRRMEGHGVTDEELSAIRERNARRKCGWCVGPRVNHAHHEEDVSPCHTIDIDALLAFVDKVRAEGYCPCGHSLKDHDAGDGYVVCYGDNHACRCINSTTWWKDD